MDDINRNEKLSQQIDYSFFFFSDVFLVRLKMMLRKVRAGRVVIIRSPFQQFLTHDLTYRHRHQPPLSSGHHHHICMMKKARMYNK